MRAWLLVVAATSSGVAGLAYQVAWTRRLASITSATVTAQAVVLAVFMGGLGLGAWLAGRRASGLRRPLLGYALVEVVAVLAAVGSVEVLARAGAVQVAAVEAGLSLRSGLWLELVVVALFLAIPTTAMGASLPLLLEDAQRRFEAEDPAEGATRARHFVGWLYGTNTLGAALGSFLAGLWSIEHLGLSGTIYLGALFGCTAVVVVLLPAMGSTKRSRADLEGSAAEDSRILTALAALAGALGLGAEVVWTRLLSLVMLNTVYAFSFVLGAVLVGIALGAAVGAMVVRRTPDVSRLFGAAALTWTLTSALLALVPVLVATIAEDPPLLLSLSRGEGGLWVLLAITVPAAAATASLLPILVGLARRRQSRSFGELFAANTIGSVVGSLGAGFVLLPVVGLQAANLTLSALALVGAAVSWRLAGAPLRQAWPLAAVLAVTLGVFAVQDLPRDLYRSQVPEELEIVDFREGTASDVFVTESPQGQRRIWINSAWVAGTGGGHRLLGHFPGLMHPAPRQGLGVALGTGQTFAALLQHGPEALHCVELDEGIIELSKQWFAPYNGHFFDDPRVTLHHNDGRAFMRTTDQRFDVIVLEPLQAWTAGTANLYSVEFYRDALRVLKPGGVVAQWIPFYGQDVASTRAMIRSAIEVIPQASLWLDNNDGILILHEGGFRFDAEALAGRVRARGLGRQLAQNQVHGPVDLLPLFMLGPAGLARWTEGVDPIVDDRPALEFASARDLGATDPAHAIRSLLPVLEDPRPYVTGDVGDGVRRAVLTRSVLLHEALVPASDFGTRAEILIEGLRAGADLAVVKHRHRNVTLGLAAVAGQAGPDAEARVYRRALAVDPEAGSIAFNLGVLLVQQGRAEEAKPYIAMAARLGAIPPAAVAMLEQRGLLPEGR